MMTRTRKEIQDANALLSAMAVFLAANGLKHHFGDGLKTIAAAIDQIRIEKDPFYETEAWSFPRGDDEK
jgi:hypothetical protein